MISATTTAMIRRVAASLLTDTCTISKRQDAVSEIGTPQIGMVIVAEDVPCRIIKASNSSQSEADVIGQGEALREIYRISFEPAYAAILDIDTEITANGITYDVVAIEAALTDMAFVNVIASRHR